MKISCALWFFLFANPDAIDTKFEQVHPPPKLKPIMERSRGQTRAVVLMHGLNLVASKTKVHLAIFHDWQQPKAQLVQTLGKVGDVFAFAYSQNGTLETVSQAPGLTDAIARLKQMGYEEIVLVGHSAGGLIARLFVEDNPEAGVVRVIQVDAPNLGSSWVKADLVAKKDQDPFLRSLTKEERQKSARKRLDKKIPPNVQFLCIVGASSALGDGFVSIPSQWPDDLQSQGIPAIRLNTTHFTVMRSSKIAERLAELASQNIPRWTEETWLARRKQILGN